MSRRYYNDLEIIGDDSQIASVLEYIKGEPNDNGIYKYIDFNKIVKMPGELKESLNIIPKIKHDPLCQCQDLEKCILQTQEITYLNDGYDSSVKDIIDKRNEWCYENWGCKYNPFDQQMIDDSIIRFTLTNGIGFCLIQKLSKIFNKVVFIYLIISEDPDEDEIFTFKDGRLLKTCEYDYFEKTILKGETYNSSSKIESRIFNHVKTNYKSK